jgi:hypothetical protein
MGISLLGGGLALHSAHVLRERAAAPTGRALRLSPGSADADAAEAERVLLGREGQRFSRDRREVSFSSTTLVSALT